MSLRGDSSGSKPGVNVGVWLRSLGLEEYEAAFLENEIDGSLLQNLTAEDLKDLGVSLVGHRRRLLLAIAELSSSSAKIVSSEATTNPPELAQKDSAERRQLTVLFCDLVGSTTISARIDAEDMRSVIGSYHRCCTDLIVRIGGFVAQIHG